MYVAKIYVEILISNEHCVDVGATVVPHSHLTVRGFRVRTRQLAEALLGGVCMFSLCQFGSLPQSNGTKVRLIGDFKLPVGVTMSVNGKVYPAFCQMSVEIGSSPLDTLDRTSCYR